MGGGDTWVRLLSVSRCKEVADREKKEQWLKKCKESGGIKRWANDVCHSGLHGAGLLQGLFSGVHKYL